MPFAHERCYGRPIAAVDTRAVGAWLGCAQCVAAVVHGAETVHDLGFPLIHIRLRVHGVPGCLVVEHERVEALRQQLAVHP